MPPSARRVLLAPQRHSERRAEAARAVDSDALASVLGVRRASVTEAARSLQSSGMIDYRRGMLTIRQFSELEEVACEDYRLSRDGYDQRYE